MTTDAAEFIRYLTHLPPRQKPKVLAALRRGLGMPPGTVVEMFPHVIPYAPGNPGAQRPYFLVAALFAAYPDAPRYYGDFGASFRWLDEKVQGKPQPERNGGLQRRFIALLRANDAELPTHLRHAIGMLKAHEVGVAWEHLLRDLTEWDTGQNTVQRRWAKGFWGTRSATQSTPIVPPPTTPKEDAEHDH